MRVARVLVVVLLLMGFAVCAFILNRSHVDASSDGLAVSGGPALTAALDVVLDSADRSNTDTPSGAVPLRDAIENFEPPSLRDNATPGAMARHRDTDLLPSTLFAASSAIGGAGGTSAADLLASLDSETRPYSLGADSSPLDIAACLTCGTDIGTEGWQAGAFGVGRDADGFRPFGGGLFALRRDPSGLGPLDPLPGFNGFGSDQGADVRASDGGTSGSDSIFPIRFPADAGDNNSSGDWRPEPGYVNWTGEGDPAVPAPVPEPATIVLTGTGIAAVLAARRKQRR